ncbi:MAG: hypothetical protein ACI4PQ_02630 [Butyricicoccaceae bacterium]
MRKDYQEYTTAELMQQAVDWQVERCAELRRTDCLNELETRADADAQFASVLRAALSRAQTVQDWAEDAEVSVLELAGVAESIPALSMPAPLFAQAMLERLPADGDLNDRTDAFVRMCEEIPFADEFKKYTLCVYEAKKLVLRRLCAGSVERIRQEAEKKYSALQSKVLEQESELSDLRASVDGSEQLRARIEQLERQLAEKNEEIDVLTDMIAEQDEQRGEDAQDLRQMHESLQNNEVPPMPTPPRVTFTNMQPEPPRPAPRVYTNMQPNPPREAPRAYTNMTPSALQPAVTVSEDGQPVQIPANAPTKRRYPKPSDFRDLMEDPMTVKSRRKRRSRDFLDEADKAIDRQKRAEAKARKGQKPQ